MSAVDRAGDAVDRAGGGEAVRMPFQYVVLRCVPRVDREEFVNVGVVLHCELADFLACAAHVEDDRLLALASDVDLDAVRSALAMTAAVCADDRAAWPSAGDKPGVRFRWLAAPRSTVVQPGPVHGGLTADPARELERLRDHLVR
jgi:hypothetical protein